MADGRFIVQRPADGHHTGGGVNRKQPARIVVERVRDRAGGRIGIGRKGRDAHHRAERGIFRHTVGGGVRIRHGSRVELVEVVDGDREVAGREGGVGAGGSDGDRVAGGSLGIQRGGGGDEAGVRVDGEEAAGVIVQRIADGGGAVGVGGKGDDADRRTGRLILRDGIGGGIGVADGSDRGFILVGDGDGERLRVGAAEAVIDGHRHFVDVVAVGVGGGFEVGGGVEAQSARGGVDGEPCGVRSAADRVGQRLGWQVGVGGDDRRHCGAVFGDRDGGRCATTVAGDDWGVVVGGRHGHGDGLLVDERAVADLNDEVIDVVRIGIERRFVVGCGDERQHAGVGVDRK